MRSRYILSLSLVGILALLAFVGSSLRVTASAQATGTATTSGPATSATNDPSISGGSQTTYPACPAAGSTSNTTPSGSATPAAGSLSSATPVAINTTTASTNATSTVTSGTAVGTAIGTASAPTGGYLGIEIVIVEQCGVRVNRLLTNSPAATAGVQVGDVIVAIDDQAVSTLFVGTSGISAATVTPGAGAATTTPSAGGTTTTPIATTNAGDPLLGQAFFQAVQLRSAGQSVRLTIQRAGQQLVVSVTLGTIPSGLVTPVGGASATVSAGTTSTTTGTQASTTATP